MKPYVHTFKTLKSDYFYDVNKNSVVPISSELYNYINCILAEKTMPELSNSAKQELDTLYKDGYLSSNRVKRFEHPQTKYLDDYLSRKLKNLSIELTQNCNLRCSYCNYTSNNGSSRLHNNKQISFEVIEKALNILRDNSLDNKEVSIGFYGGEPLMEFETICKTVELSKTIFKGKKVNYTVTTNGTLFSDDILNFMEQNDFMLVISLDGPKEINDLNRKFSNTEDSVFEKVIFWVERIISNYPNFKNKFGINMVIDPRQDFTQYSKLFTDYPVLNEVLISINTVDDSNKVEKYKQTEDFNKKSNYARFLAYLNFFDEIEFKTNHFYSYFYNQLISKMIEGFDTQEKLDECFAPSGPCTPGEHRLFLNTEGIFFPCERISEIPEINMIGDVVNGLSTEKSSKVLNISRSQFSNCQDCFAFRGCSNCVKAFDNYDNDKDSIKVMCELSREDFNYELVGRTIMQEIKEI